MTEPIPPDARLSAHNKGVMAYLEASRTTAEPEAPPAGDEGTAGGGDAAAGGVRASGKKAKRRQSAAAAAAPTRAPPVAAGPAATALGTLLLVNRLVAQQDTLRTHRVLWQVWLVLTLLSLIRWSLNDDLDIYGLYYFGAYGLGLLAFRARQSRIPLKGWVVLTLMGLLALWVDPRWRVTTAWSVALLLASAPDRWSAVPAAPGIWRQGVQRLSRISYSVFMIHYAVSLLVSALVTAFWPESVLANGLGMLVAVLGAVLAGAGLYQLTEKTPQDWRHWGMAVGIFMASVALAMKMSA